MGIKKLVIQACTPEGAPKAGEKFTAQINPERFTHSKTVQSKTVKGTETAQPSTTDSAMGHETVSFELYFDGTGAIPDSKVSVDDNIAALSKIVYHYKGELHASNVLHLIWGGFAFQCKLTSMNVDYTLFHSQGKALRAKVKLDFKQYITPEKSEKEANKSSPDLTHIKLVRIGDMLPLMCNDVYGSSDYYLQVAEANGLTNFRSLEIGTSLFFPPIKK